MDAIGALPLDFALATKFTGLPTVAPLAGELIVTPVPPDELVVELELELAEPTVKFTVWE